MMIKLIITLLIFQSGIYNITLPTNSRWDIEFIDLTNDGENDLFINSCSELKMYCDIFIFSKWIGNHITIPHSNFISLDVDQCTKERNKNCIIITELIKDGYYESEFLYESKYNNFIAIYSNFFDEKESQKTDLMYDKYIFTIDNKMYKK